MTIKKTLIIIAAATFTVALLVATIYIYSIVSANNRLASEKSSILAHKNIMNSFLSEDNRLFYHANYAGAYLNPNKRLVVLIAPDQEQKDKKHGAHVHNLLTEPVAFNSSAFRRQSEKFQEIAYTFVSLAGHENISNIHFQKALYSYEYLTGLMTHFNYYFLRSYSDPASIWYYVTGFTLHDDRNIISVEILNFDDLKETRFRAEVIDSNATVIQNSRASVFAESLHAGMRANIGSIGFRARMNDTNYRGFVTAGHNVRAGTPVYRRGRIGVGIVSIVDSTLDAAFVRTDDIVGEISNTTHTGRLISDINVHPLVGSTVFKEGRETGLTVGTLISANATHRYTLHHGHVSVRRQNLIIADYISAANDSGGIVYDINGHVFGIHIAGPAHGQSGERLIENVTDIQNILNVTFY